MIHRVGPTTAILSGSDTEEMMAGYLKYLEKELGSINRGYAMFRLQYSWNDPDIVIWSETNPDCYCQLTPITQARPHPDNYFFKVETVRP